MAGLVRGKIIYGDSSGDPAALTVGSNGQALVSDGTDISWGSAGASLANDGNNRVVTGDGSGGLNGEANLSFDGSTLAVTGAVTVSGTTTFSDDILIVDDKGIDFGTGSDFHLGLIAGESQLKLSVGGDVSNDTEWKGGGFNWTTGTSGTAIFAVIANEGSGPFLKLLQDEYDDNADNWGFGQNAGNNGANTSLFWGHYAAGSWDMEMRLTQDGDFATDGTHSASTAVDYAEYFEWKTELASDEAVTNAYGLTVVLDNDKVRLAEAGEEADVLGVVRPNSTSAMVGGTQTFKWKEKYQTDVWGKIQYEPYTLVKWTDNGHEHRYHSDRIPAKKPIADSLVNKSDWNWHLLESNLTADDLVVPTTDEEKAAANYEERNVYRRNKGKFKIGDPLLRPVVNPSYDSTRTYLPRDERRKEWCIVGLLGQVPIRNTAIIPAHWKLMKNVESGIDLYYIK